MPIIRKPQPKIDVTPVPNEIIHDDNLSWGAKGLYAFFLSFGMDEEGLGMCQTDIEKLNINLTYANELVGAGYLAIDWERE